MEFRHELVIPNPDIPFRMFLFEGMNGSYRVGKHWHRSVEVFAVMEGELSFYINSTGYEIRPGDILLVNSNEIHSIEAPDPNQVIVLQIPLRFFEAYCTDGYIRFSQLDREKDNEMYQAVCEIFRIYEEKAFGYELLVQSKTLEFIYRLITTYQIKEYGEEWIAFNRNIDKLSSVTGYIRSNYAQELSLKGVAAVFGFSPTYLSRMFQKYAGVNYKTYLQNVRVEYGFKELVNTDKTICDIAYNNGFPNSKSFSKSFQERYGMLPGDYRKMLKEQKRHMESRD